MYVKITLSVRRDDEPNTDLMPVTLDVHAPFNISRDEIRAYEDYAKDMLVNRGYFVAGCRYETYRRPAR